MPSSSMSVTLPEELTVMCINLYNEVILISDEINNLIGNNSITQFEYFYNLECHFHKKLCIIGCFKTNKYYKTRIVYELLIQVFLRLK
jgi:hypothetical protein